MEWSLKEILTPENLYTIGVAIGTILFTAWVTVKSLMKQLDDNAKKSRGEVSKSVKQQSAIDVAIIDEATRLKDLLEADRVQVYEFHNGTHYANGRSALKTTCTYEVCRYGVSSHSNLLSGLPLSCIPNFIKVLLDKGEFSVKKLEDIEKTMPSTYNFKKSMGITSFYDVVINNIKGEPIGFIAIQFCDGNEHDVNKTAIRRFAWFVEQKLIENSK